MTRLETHELTIAFLVSRVVTAFNENHLNWLHVMASVDDAGHVPKAPSLEGLWDFGSQQPALQP